MIRQNADTPTNGGPPVPNRLAMNRLGPQKGPSMPPPAKKTAEPAANGEDLAQNRLTAKKLAEEKARARTVARAQAVAEKLSTATDQVSSAIAEATGAVEELEKTMHTIAAGADQASSAAEESRAAINQIEKASDRASDRAEVSLKRVNELQALAKSTTTDRFAGSSSCAFPSAARACSAPFSLSSSRLARPLASSQVTSSGCDCR